jgi:hypothetical protein
MLEQRKKPLDIVSYAEPRAQSYPKNPGQYAGHPVYLRGIGCKPILQNPEYKGHQIRPGNDCTSEIPKVAPTLSAKGDDHQRKITIHKQQPQRQLLGAPFPTAFQHVDQCVGKARQRHHGANSNFYVEVGKQTCPSPCARCLPIVRQNTCPSCYSGLVFTSCGNGCGLGFRVANEKIVVGAITVPLNNLVPYGKHL